MCDCQQKIIVTQHTSSTVSNSFLRMSKLSLVLQLFSESCHENLASFLIVCWQVIMAPSSPMARPEVGRPLQSLEVRSIIMTEGSSPELFLTFIIISARSVDIFISFFLKACIQQKKKKKKRKSNLGWNQDLDGKAGTYFCKAFCYSYWLVLPLYHIA